MNWRKWYCYLLKGVGIFGLPRIDGHVFVHRMKASGDSRLRG